MKKHKTYILTILINLFIFYFAIIYIKKSPLGNHVLGISDGIAQFKPMIYDLIMKIKTGTLEMYSFNNGLGNPFIFNFLYYTGSPINLIGLLFNNPDSIYLAIITLKIILASITMTFYTSKKTDRKDVIIISSISYVFCTWFIVYYFYLAWVDIFFIFPLFQYGLEKNIDSNKISYCIILARKFKI